jgi:hypothetical protein
MLDLFNDKVVSVDYNRDQGFLTGMGIPVNDPKKNGDEAKTGSYTGGTYTIVCNEAGNGAADGGRAAMERCLTKNPDINLVYTINEPTAVGANAALKAAGQDGDDRLDRRRLRRRRGREVRGHRCHRAAVPAEDGRARASRPSPRSPPVARSRPTHRASTSTTLAWLW